MSLIVLCLFVARFSHVFSADVPPRLLRMEIAPDGVRHIHRMPVDDQFHHALAAEVAQSARELQSDAHELETQVEFLRSDTRSLEEEETVEDQQLSSLGDDMVRTREVLTPLRADTDRVNELEQALGESEWQKSDAARHASETSSSVATAFQQAVKDKSVLERDVSSIEQGRSCGEGCSPNERTVTLGTRSMDGVQEMRRDFQTMKALLRSGEADASAIERADEAEVETLEELQTNMLVLEHEVSRVKDEMETVREDEIRLKETELRKSEAVHDIEFRKAETVRIAAKMLAEKHHLAHGSVGQEIRESRQDEASFGEGFGSNSVVDDTELVEQVLR